jgi:hypothetical protein
MKSVIVGFITFLMFAFYGSSWRCHGQGLVIPQAQVYPVAPVSPAQLRVYYAHPAPPVVYVPQIQVVPYQYDRTEVYRRFYRTPLRDALFGRYRAFDYYRPAAPVDGQ